MNGQQLDSGDIDDGLTLSNFKTYRHTSSTSRHDKGFILHIDPVCCFPAIKVYTTTHHDDLHKVLSQRWDVLDNNPAPLFKVLNKALVEAGDPLKVCGLDVKKEWQFAVPAMERAPGYRPSTNRVLWPTIELTDGTSVSPVRSIAPGETYQVGKG